MLKKKKKKSGHVWVKLPFADNSELLKVFPSISEMEWVRI